MSQRTVPYSFQLSTRDKVWSPAEFGRLVTDIGYHLERLPLHEPIALHMSADGLSAAALLAVWERGQSALLLPTEVEDGMLHELLHLVHPATFITSRARDWIGRLEGHAIPLGPRGVLLSLPVSPLNKQHNLPTDGSICQLTSGSLEAAHPVSRAYAGIHEEVHALNRRLRFAEERILCASSIAHSYGLIAGLLAPVASGATQIALAASPVDACVLASVLRPTIIIGLATTYQAFLQSDLPTDALASARVLLTAGAPLPPGLYDAFWRHYHLPIRQDYGTTETGTIALNYPGIANPQVVGEPLPHLEVRVGVQTEQPLDTREEGEIQVRGHAVALGYLDPHGLRGVVDGDGWYHTGDVGAITADRALRIDRRLRCPVMIDGLLVRPEKVEQAIAAMPGVAEVAVLSTQLQGKAAIKAVVVAPGVTIRQIRAWCLAHLPSTSVPTIIIVCDALPRSPAGKILYSKL